VTPPYCIARCQQLSCGLLAVRWLRPILSRDEVREFTSKRGRRRVVVAAFCELTRRLLLGWAQKRSQRA